jgi:hypothetical protein
VLDVNGQDLREGDLAQLLCEVFSIEADGIGVRILNSDMRLFVAITRDEALGGLVAASELTRFVTAHTNSVPDLSSEEVKPWRME